MIFEKPLGQITIDDIKNLVTNKVRESTTLDYKLEIPGKSDSDKKEFLGDVCSFANSSGGYIIYGVKEDRNSKNEQTGMPESIPGLPGFNAELEELRLNQMIRDSLDPRIPGVEIRTISGFDNGPVLLIYIPRSFSTPHVVTFNDSFRFYGRTSAGKYRLDVREVTSLVLQASAVPDRLRAFRTERLAKIIARETPVPIRGTPVHILHVVPLNAFTGMQPFDISKIEQAGHLWPPEATSRRSRYTIDGFLSSSSSWTEPTIAYTLVFRNGTAEIVISREDWTKDDVSYLPSVGYERYTIDHTKVATEFLLKQGLQPPFVVMASIVGVKNSVLLTRANERGVREKFVFGVDNLILPDILLRDAAEDIPRALKPIFDVLWQAGGFSGSDSYREDGSWNPPNRSFF